MPPLPFAQIIICRNLSNTSAKILQTSDILIFSDRTVCTVELFRVLRDSIVPGRRPNHRLSPIDIAESDLSVETAHWLQELVFGRPKNMIEEVKPRTLSRRTRHERTRRRQRYLAGLHQDLGPPDEDDSEDSLPSSPEPKCNENNNCLVCGRKQKMVKNDAVCMHEARGGAKIKSASYGTKIVKNGAVCMYA